MYTALVLFFCFLVGYQFFLTFTHPQKKKNKIPHIALKNIELSPNVKIHFRGKTYWIHHWLLLSCLAGFFSFTEGLLTLLTIKAIMAGGIAQGLSYKDRFHFRHPREK